MVSAIAAHRRDAAGSNQEQEAGSQAVDQLQLLRQNCQPVPPPEGVQHRKLLPGGPPVPGRIRRHPEGVRGSQLPQLQDAEHTSWPQLSPLGQARVAPGAHVPPPEQLPVENAPQVQSDWQVRVRVRLPRLQLPQGSVSFSTWPGVQSPPPPPLQAPQSPKAPNVQSAPQLRERVWLPPPPHPQERVSVSNSPGMQPPSPPQASPPQLQSA